MAGCGKRLKNAQWFFWCGETDMGQTPPALCTECGGSFILHPKEKTKICRAYLAAGWFSDKQENSRLEIIKALTNAGLDFYSPKEDGLYVPGKTDPQDVFNENVDQIKACDFVIASTEGKDVGTLFECGMAHILKKPIVYYWKGEGKFNLMLGQSAVAVCRRPEELKSYFNTIAMMGKLIKVPFIGDVE